MIWHIELKTQRKNSLPQRLSGKWRRKETTAQNKKTRNRERERTRNNSCSSFLWVKDGKKEKQGERHDGMCVYVDWWGVTENMQRQMLRRDQELDEKTEKEKKVREYSKAKSLREELIETAEEAHRARYETARAQEWRERRREQQTRDDSKMVCECTERSSTCTERVWKQIT